MTYCRDTMPEAALSFRFMKLKYLAGNGFLSSSSTRTWALTDLPISTWKTADKSSDDHLTLNGNRAVGRIEYLISEKNL